VEGPPDEIPPPRSFAPEPKLDRVLEQRLRDLAKEHHGKVALYAWQLNTTRAVAIDAEQTVQTANAVKLALLWDSLRQISLGDTTWNEKLGNITLQDAFTRLTFTGDPAAATQLANRFTTHRVEEDMITLGYSGTWLPTHPNAAQTLAPGKTTPKQVVSLLQHIGMCDLDLPKQLHVNIPRSEMACRAAAGILRDKLYRDSIPEAPGSAPQGEGVLTKTLSTGRSDIAILAAKTGPIVLAVYTYDNAAGADQARSIADITKAILDAWSPDGTDAKVFDKTHLGVSWE
jgi:beta-lactamase class A